jgi:16S rRNA (adenine(1408)-N(1))-methyltransferase
MRILQGTKVIEAPAAVIETIREGGRPVVVDLGAGDGRYVYESARDVPGTLYVAIDPDAATLAEYAFRASRKAARGGVENAVFVVAAVESLPPELAGVADRVRVNYPWGSLMRGLLEVDFGMIRAILGLAKPGGGVEIVMSYDPSHDTGAFQGPPLPALDAPYLESVMIPAYGVAGATVVEARRMTQDEALAIPSTWGRRLLHPRPREVFWIAMKATVSQ